MAGFPYRIMVEWSEEDDAYLARVPALPGCVAHGPTSDVAAGEAQTAAEAILSVMKEDGRQIPSPDAVADYSGNIRLRLPKSLHEQLDRLATAEGVSLNQVMVSILSEGFGKKDALDAARQVYERALEIAHEMKSAGRAAPRGGEKPPRSKPATRERKTHN